MDSLLRDVNLVGMELIENGITLRLTLVEGLPPYNPFSVCFRNTIMIRWCREPLESFPMFIVDLTLKLLDREELASLLSEAAYPLLSEETTRCNHDKSYILAHFEGAVNGDIIAESITKEEQAKENG